MKAELGIKLPAPTVSDRDVERLCEWLQGNGWVRGSVLAAQLGINDRLLRAMAEASDGKILSGQAGYRLFDRSTPLEEADRAASWLESQGHKMLKRGAAIRRRFHNYSRDSMRLPA